MKTSSPVECINAFSCELEDWFHILDSDKAPGIEDWSKLPLCAERNVERLLQLFSDNGVQATFFCLGWMAERLPHLVRRCLEAGHEIGSHGYGHVLAYQVGPGAFLADLVRSKGILEDITGEEVVGFRSPGFCITDENRWVFDVVAKAGYRYDASVFPAHHGHGGLCTSNPQPHVIETANGPLVEIPMSTVRLFGHRVCLFGGGYLRLAPLPLIRWGVKRLQRAGQPLVVYVHPRELDPDHPRLSLPLRRRFKCYVNLSSTLPKLAWLCGRYRFRAMREVAARVDEGIGRTPVTVPTARARTEPVTTVVGAARRSTVLAKEAI